MSSASVNPPPQTYSRLFRPWDTHRTQDEIKQQRNTRIKYTPAMEITAKTRKGGKSSSTIDHENDERCALSSRSSNNSVSSFDDSFQGSSELDLAIPNYYPNLVADGNIRNVQHHFQDSLEPSLQLTASLIANTGNSNSSNSGSTPSPSDIYYAAAHSVAANGLPLAAASAFGMDPYTLRLMEQEYARVMAEEAHFKALNARKQRPKKFKCPHCDVAFSNNGQLKGHVRIHTGERPFKCDTPTCGKTFTRNEELTRHKRIHTGLRPYPCTACGKKFGRRDHLKKHMKTHMPQERHLGPAIFVPMYPYLYGY